MDDGDVRTVAIVLAAGAGRRLGTEVPKALLPIGGRPILTVATAAAAASPAVGAVVVTAPAGYEDVAGSCLEGMALPCRVITGGASRQASVRAALEVIGDDVDVVVVHDAARPFAPPDLFTAVIEAVTNGAVAAIPVLPVTDTVKTIEDGRVAGTVDRRSLALAQTPQAFRLPPLRVAHARALAEAVEVTDDAMLLEGEGTILALPGEPGNFKITTMLDLARAESRIGGRDG